MLSKTLVNIAYGLNHSKELRDLFVDLVENVGILVKCLFILGIVQICTSVPKTHTHTQTHTHTFVVIYDFTKCNT